MAELLVVILSITAVVLIGGLLVWTVWIALTP